MLDFLGDLRRTHMCGVLRASDAGKSAVLMGWVNKRRDHGSLLFIEHGLCPEVGVARWQRRLTPVWPHVSGGCHLDRRMDDLIRSAGLELTVRNEYAEGPRIFTYMYKGCARPVA